MWARNDGWILPEMPDFHVAFRNLLHAVNLRHGTDGFTSTPKEGVLRIFSPWKIQRLRPGLNPRTWVPKASTPPLDHRSRNLLYAFFLIQTPGNYPEESIQHSEHGKSLKSRKLQTYTWNGSLSHYFNIAKLQYVLINFTYFRISIF